MRALLAIVVWFLIQQTLCVPPEQKAALQDFYSASADTTLWDPSSTWNFANDPCSPTPDLWVGITCGSGNIVQIDLSFLEIQGSIPTSWRNLVDVTSM